MTVLRHVRPTGADIGEPLNGDNRSTAPADTGLIDGLLKKVSEMNEEVTSKCLGI